MDREKLRREVGLFDAELTIAAAWTPPSSWYTDPDFWALDQTAVFARSWQPVARVAELDAPGAFKSGVFAGEPWVIVRQSDGSLRAFANVCRHKAAIVAQGSGRCDHLVCPYHGWKYDLDGRLRSAPRMAGIQNFDRADMSLRPLPVEAWGPWIFISFRADAPPLAQGLGPLTARLNATDWAALDYRTGASWTIECNWKVYIDNYLDGGYHIPHMHPTLDAQLKMDDYITELFPRYSVQSSPANSGEDQRIGFDASQRIGSGAVYAWLYPNFMINRYGPVLDTNWVIPLGPDRCQVHYEFFFDASVNEAFIAESVEQSAVTQREDITISEWVQAGLRSAHYDRGRYAPGVEIGELHFHGLLKADYTAALSKGG